MDSHSILVCFAVMEEAAPLKKLLTEPAGATVLVTGIGAANARRAFTQALESSPPAVVLTCGFAGALDPTLKVGDVIFRTADPELDSTLVKLSARPADFHCSSRVATTIAEKETLRRTTGAGAVEMESGIIQDLCRERGILRCATVRAISDTADKDLPLDFNALMGADGNISMAKLAGALLKSPGKVPRLLELQRDTRLAAGRLAEVLHGLLRTIGSGGSRAD